MNQAHPGGRIVSNDRLLTASLVLTLAASANAQTHVYVDDDAPAGGDGLSWNSAFNDLHDAIDLAKALGQNRGEIRIADGMYKPDQGTGDISMAFHLPLPEAGEPVFTLIGGYAGLSNPASPDDVNTYVYHSTLSGDLAGNDTNSASSRLDNAARLLVIEGAQTFGATPVSAVVLSGIGFGGATQSAFSNTGAGIEARFQQCRFFDNVGDSGCVADLTDSVLFMEYCTIENNAANSAGSSEGCIRLVRAYLDIQFSDFLNNRAESGRGGAIFADSSTIDMWFGYFQDNFAQGNGGAIILIDSILDSVNSQFEGNRSEGYGGAIFSSNSQTETTSSEFIENSARVSGGAVFASLGSLRTSGLFENNSAGRSGGAIYVGDLPEPDLVSIGSGRFIGNTATELGGAVMSLSHKTIVHSCEFTGNSTGFIGGGAYVGGYVTQCDFDSNDAFWGGGLSVIENSRVRWCEFTKNTADEGGAIMGEPVGVLIEDSAFTENSSTGNGGAISTAEIVTTSIFTGNTAKDSGGAMYGVDRIERTSVLSNYAARGGALHNPREILSSLIRNNTAAYGGAIYSNRNWDLSITDSVFLNNDSTQLGTHIYKTAASAVDIIRSTLASNNTASLPMLNISGGFVWIESSIIWDKASNPAPTIQLSQSTSAVIIHSCTRLGPGDIQTVSPSDVTMLGLNIGFDPMFKSISTGDLSLRPTSPCIDSGLQAVGSNLPSTDVYGAPRGPKDDLGLSNRGLGVRTYLDIGAIEFGGTSCLADTTFDGFLSPIDFNVWIAAFNTGNPVADQNRDNALTPADFTAWVANYSAGCP